MANDIQHIITYKTDILEAQQKKTEPKFYKYRVAVLNSFGKTALEVEFLPTGGYRYEAKYAYNKDGEPERKRVSFPQKKSVEDTVVKYDEQGRQVEERFYFNKKLYDRVLFKFNDKGLETDQIRVDAEENLLEREEYDYNNNEQLIEKRHYDKDNQLSMLTKYIYDDEGRLIQEMTVVPIGDEPTAELNKYTYDELGRKVRSEVLDKEGNLKGFVLIDYNEDNKPVRYYSETIGVHPTKIVNQITYNEEGLVTENEYFDILRGVTVSYERLKYDEEKRIKEQESIEIDSDKRQKTRHQIIQIFYDFKLPKRRKKKEKAASA